MTQPEIESLIAAAIEAATSPLIARIADLESNIRAVVMATETSESNISRLATGLDDAHSKIAVLEKRPELSADYIDIDLAKLVSDSAHAQNYIAELNDPDGGIISELREKLENAAGYHNADWADRVLEKYHANDKP